MKKLMVFCALMLMACAPVQNTVQATATVAMATATSAPTATAIATATMTATVTATATATATPGPTNTPTSLPNVINGKVIGFTNNVLTVGLNGSGTANFTVTDETLVVVVPITPTPKAGYPPVLNPAEALQAAARENAPVRIERVENTVRFAVVSLPNEIVAKDFPTLGISQMATATAVRVSAQLTRTPVTPDPPPAVHRTFDLPWGKVDLDLPIAETNRYAMALWCEWLWAHLNAADLPMWFTNPVGMISGRAYHRYVLNVEIIEKEAKWRVSNLGNKYFYAWGIVRHTPDKSDTQQIRLIIGYGAGILTNMPSDHRLYNGPGKPNSNYLAPVEGFTVTDPSQVRVGQIYGIAYYDDFRWPKPISQIETFYVQPQGSELVIYTVMPEWEWSCAYRQQMGWIKPGS